MKLLSVVVVCITVWFPVRLSSDTLSVDFSSGIDPSFLVYKERGFWTVESDPVNGLVISKPYDDGSTFEEAHTSAGAGVVSSFVINGDFRIEMNYGWFAGVSTPEFGGGHNEVGFHLQSTGHPSENYARVRNLRHWSGQHLASSGGGRVFSGSLAGQLVLERIGDTAATWATDEDGLLSLLGNMDASSWSSPIRIYMTGWQWQLTSSVDYEQIDPRGPMTVSIGSVTVTATSIIPIPDMIFAHGFEGENTISTVDDPENWVGQENDLAVGTDGLPVIAYWDATAGALKVAKCNDRKCAGSDEIITTVHDPLESAGVGVSLAIPSDGLPIMVYENNGGPDQLHITKCNDPACTGSDETTTTLSMGTLHYSMQIAADGLPIFALSGGGGMQVAKCNDAACSGMDESFWTVGGIQPLEKSMAVPPDNNPVISFYEKDDGSLQMVKCNDPDCTGGDELTSVVDNSDTQIGVWNDLTIGDDGLPIICYNDNIAGNLKAAKCNDAACSGGDENLSIVDASHGQVGGFCSIDIGKDGMPVIAYQVFVDNTESSLRVAKCNDAACSGGDETITTLLEFHVIDINLVIGADGLPIISFYNGSSSGSSSLMTIYCGTYGCN